MNKLFVSVVGLLVVFGLSGVVFADDDVTSRYGDKSEGISCNFYSEVFSNLGSNPFSLERAGDECDYVCPPAPGGACTNGRTTCVDPTLRNEWSCEFTCVAGVWATPGTKCPHNMCFSTKKC